MCRSQVLRYVDRRHEPGANSAEYCVLCAVPMNEVVWSVVVNQYQVPWPHRHLLCSTPLDLHGIQQALRLRRALGGAHPDKECKDGCLVVWIESRLLVLYLVFLQHCAVLAAVGSGSNLKRKHWQHWPSQINSRGRRTPALRSNRRWPGLTSLISGCTQASDGLQVWPLVLYNPFVQRWAADRHHHA